MSVDIWFFRSMPHNNNNNTGWDRQTPGLPPKVQKAPGALHCLTVVTCEAAGPWPLPVARCPVPPC